MNAPNRIFVLVDKDGEVGGHLHLIGRDGGSFLFCIFENGFSENVSKVLIVLSRTEGLLLAENSVKNPY